MIMTFLFEKKSLGWLIQKLFQKKNGQEKLKSSLRIAIDASIYRKEPLEHTLLYGQPGLGKTTLAFLIANAMNTRCRIATAPAIERPRDIVGLLLAWIKRR